MTPAEELLGEVGLNELFIEECAKEAKGGTHPELEETFRALRERVKANGIDRVGRSAARSCLLAWLKNAKVQNAAALADSALELDRSEKTPEPSILSRDPEPWATPVDGAELLDLISGQLARFVVESRSNCIATSLWVLFSWCHDAFRISPILAIQSAVRGCGKTVKLDVVARMTPRSMMASNASTAALFRLIDAWGPTLCLDEVDTFLTSRDADPELRGLVNSGHRRSSALFARCVGENHDVNLFRTWCPKSVACIGKLPEATQSRCISTTMRRKLAEETVEAVRDDDASFDEIKAKCRRWALDNMAELTRAEPELPTWLPNRDGDNWRPLVAISELCGGRTRELTLEAARALTGEADDESLKETLLGDIRDAFEAKGEKQLWSYELVNFLVALEGRPWPSWSKGRGLTKNGLANLIKPFGITPDYVRRGEVVQRGYSRSQFEDVFSRYLSRKGSV